MNTKLPTNRKFNNYYLDHQKLLQLNGYRPKTIDAYCRGIRRIGNYFNGQITELNQQQLLNYFSDLLKCKSWNTVKLDLYGLRFFYTRVLHKTWEDIPLIKPPKIKRIPDIVSILEAHRLFNATEILIYRVFFFTLYSMGLRLGEGIHLKTGDIDSVHMRVHIRNAKGNKDRFVPLPNKTLLVLRQFWLTHKHPDFIFPNRKRGIKKMHMVDTPLDRGGVQTAIQAVVRSIRIKKNFMPLTSS